MSAKNSAIPPEIYQLKVTLLGTSPPIWRRLLVPSDLTLAQLHDVLQVAMGWQECHMHEFSVGVDSSGGLIQKTGSWECHQSKMSAEFIFRACCAALERGLSTRTILATVGSTALF
jgi:hypothetical protein